MTEIKKFVLNVDNTTTNFIREDLVEEREAELLRSLELSEDTVDVLEQLLAKYAEEVRRLRVYNDLLRSMPSTSAPAVPPFQAPWHHRIGDHDMTPLKIWCSELNGMKVHQSSDLSNGGLLKDIVDIIRDIEAGVDPISAINKRG